MKKLLGPLLFVCGALFGNSFDERLTALENAPMVVKRNPSARPTVSDSYHFFLSGDFLFWQATQGGLEYALEAGLASVIGPRFRWGMGARAAFGYHIGHDAWDLRVEWTGFHCNSNSRTPDSSSGFFPIWASPFLIGSTSIPSANSQWHISLTLVDNEVSRPYWIGTKLRITPALAVRLLWIRQNYNISYPNVIFNETLMDDQIRMSNNYRGIGPNLSVKGEWDLGAGWSIYGTGGWCLLYGPMKFNRRELISIDPETPQKTTFQQHKTRLVRSAVQLGLGLLWDYYFDKNHYHLGLSLGWETLQFFGQNQMFRTVDSSTPGSIIANEGDLSFQGGTLKLRLDF